LLPSGTPKSKFGKRALSDQERLERSCQIADLGGKVPENNYKKYRGKCKEYCEKLIEENPKLRLVRGWYLCPIWGTQEEHWWCKDEDENVIDPTRLQFPSAGHGGYVEFAGNCFCENCGTAFPEEEAIHMGRYVVCSGLCAKKLVGI